MIVTTERLEEVCSILSVAGEYGLDSETDGTDEDARFFGISITTATEKYYFNFNRNAPESNQILDRAIALPLLRKVFGNPDSCWDLSNAKFDLRMFSREGLELAGSVHCTQAIERVVYNGYMQYSLAACAARRGLQKSEAVAEYIATHKLFTVVNVPGKKKRVKQMRFDLVPFKVMAPYAEHDAHLSRTIAADQRKKIEETENHPDYPSLRFVYENEKKLTKTLARVEGYGLRLDPVITQKALDYEMSQAAAARAEFQKVTGEPFVNSGKALSKIFDQFGEPYLRTEAGNPSFTADWLDELESPLGGLINGIRRPEKRAGTYFGSYLHLVTDDGRVHCDIRQGGTETGRLSASDPNLTNIPKEDEDEDMAKPFHVRECFIPSEGFFFLDLDWQAIQYRLMVDMAGEMKLLRAIMDGQDVHEATAQLVGVPRKQAKTLNFALLFGAGAKKVALMLGISLREAKMLINLYFARLPKIEQFTKAVIATGRSRGFVFNPYGRRCHIGRPDWAYILPCHIIQGTEGDTLKIAMNKIDDLLQAKKARTRMVLPVHDQILFEMHPNEQELVKPIVGIMESVYDPFSRNGMKLLTSVEHSTTRWGKRHLIKGLPNVA